MFKTLTSLVVACMLGLLLGSAPALAGPAAQPEVKLQAFQVLSLAPRSANPQERERLQPLPPTIAPGDVLEYEARYINGTAKDVRDAQLTLPVPAGAVYLPSANAALPVDSGSLDGQRFAPLPLRREVRLPDGRREMQEVPMSEVRFLRWKLGTLPAGAERTVRARVRLVPVVGSAPGAGRA